MRQKSSRWTLNFWQFCLCTRAFQRVSLAQRREKASHNNYLVFIVFIYLQFSKGEVVQAQESVSGAWWTASSVTRSSLSWNIPIPPPPLAWANGYGKFCGVSSVTWGSKASSQIHGRVLAGPCSPIFQVIFVLSWQLKHNREVSLFL